MRPVASDRVPGASTSNQPPVAVVRFSGDDADPITMLFIDATIEIMLVARSSVPGDQRRIKRDLWAVAGVYLLLGPPTRDDYVVRVVDHDFRQDTDETLQSHEMANLDDRYLPAIVSALHLAGVPVHMETP